ncbi:MAG: heavy-metal-associated domain-containing protein [Paludibacter sp.]|jgi:copper chaperone CopZ|nr:heavy-metal-associated domain-containing protein [Paludibacter sp.]
MKTKLVLSVIFSVLFSFTAFSAKQTAIFNVSNMHGEHCKKIIEKNIAYEKGVKALTFDLTKNLVTITFDDAKTNTEKLQTALKKIGYDATLETSKTETKKK